MKKQLRVFSGPFRKTYRARRPPRLLQISKAKRRKAKQAFRRQKTARLVGGTGTEWKASEWSAEQLEQIWRSTTG